MSTFIDASDASRYAARVAAYRARLVPMVVAIMRAEGPAIRDEVRGRAPVTNKVPGYANTIGSRVRPTQGGATITVESRSPFGYILEFGAARSGPHPHFGPAFEPAAARVEAAVSALLGKVL